jgi:hypothetical protein
MSWAIGIPIGLAMFAGALVIRISAHRTALSAVARYEEMAATEIKDETGTGSVVWTNKSFSRAEVQPLVNALVQIYESEGYAPTMSKAIARDALDYAGRLGF